MTREQFEQLMNHHDFSERIDGDTIFKGLKVFNDVLPANSELVEGADHDVVYGPSIDSLIENGITEEQVLLLNQLRWHIDENNEGLQHYC